MLCAKLTADATGTADNHGYLLVRGFEGNKHGGGKRMGHSLDEEGERAWWGVKDWGISGGGGSDWVHLTAGRMCMVMCMVRQ